MKTLTIFMLVFIALIPISARAEIIAQQEADFQANYNGHPDTAGSGTWHYMYSDNSNPTLGSTGLLIPYQNGYYVDPDIKDWYPDVELLPHNNPTWVTMAPEVGDPSYQQYCVMRWTSGVTSLVNVTGTWTHYWNLGDGMDVAVYVDGVEKFRTFLESGLANFYFDVLVSVGSTVDYVLGTGPEDNGSYDRAYIETTITLLNQPPVAVCQEAVVPVGEVPNIDGGSYDPDGDPITLSQSPSGAFIDAGIYEVTLTVTDSHGATDSCMAMVVVYDPSGGFVTGGGWIDSPAGAYKPDDTLAGKANFGFVSKYKKGANVPTGNTEFQFKAGDLNFHSSSYQWLVVNQGGTNAQFKGSGTINGEGNYKFMLWAGDGEPDTFRIKIWEENGTEVVVYDNDVQQAIGGGSIMIHTK